MVYDVKKFRHYLLENQFIFFVDSYASRQLNNAENNYTTIEREGLSMVYDVKKFRHYLLENQFIFFVD